MTVAEGLLLVDKPRGVTSHDVVDVVRRGLGTRKVGHAGTLDPMATGLLLIGVGRATRLLRFLGALPKTYEGTLRLGVETTTLDADGDIVRETGADVSETDVAAAMRTLVGESLQRPPAYSAVKVGGRKLYEAAREGERLEASRARSASTRSTSAPSTAPDATFRVTCSAGTYVRVLAADVGAALRAAPISPRSAGPRSAPTRLTDAVAPDRARDPLPIDAAVGHLPRLELHAEEALAASHGRPLGPAGMTGPYGVFAPDGHLIGVYEDDGPRARPQVILASD